MANYQKAFQYAFNLESTDPNGTLIGLKNLALWRTLSVHGFSQEEISALCEDLYMSELWQLLKGAQIYDQKTAGLLLLVASKGLLGELLAEMQYYLGIKQSRKMCDATIGHINRMSASKLQQWLFASVAYFELVRQKQAFVKVKAGIGHAEKDEIIPNIGILSV
ncbi:hypothetical protein [Pseudoalteromonas luteoviolacea]|uniref:Uncharacterized protein n=1 Tax=Pseudoalteromonas luteoviolacea NCIMB 1942 TaxID=1365253 RepID=A0A167H7S2_9GAMM|nr:hypothetical protein [Pseudoalteromonas luteoviolacea]KZN57728.1 hypothetical protein N482_04310 [Pseudoalteromonas luteoviolacea NCIMB 1942]KZW99901.1 hypothetical protein JL49_14835 [Pseudoalteromonas luteoviolacea]